MFIMFNVFDVCSIENQKVYCINIQVKCFLIKGATELHESLCVIWGYHVRRVKTLKVYKIKHNVCCFLKVNEHPLILY